MLQADGGTVRVRSVVSGGSATVIFARSDGRVRVTSLVTRLRGEVGDAWELGEDFGDTTNSMPYTWNQVVVVSYVKTHNCYYMWAG
jgi:hypothetical protein